MTEIWATFEAIFYLKERRDEKNKTDVARTLNFIVTLEDSHQ